MNTSNDTIKTPTSTERNRLRLLKELDIQHCPKEEAIQRLVSMVGRVFKMPMVGITFMDQTKHIVKYNVGIDAPEIPRHVCLCSLSYEDDKAPIYTVPDTLLDERLKDHPFVCNLPFIRFYCGASIFVDNVKIGVICVLDLKPHPEFNSEQQQVLVEIANCAADLLNNKRVSNRDSHLWKEIVVQHGILSDVQSPLSQVNHAVINMRCLLDDAEQYYHQPRKSTSSIASSVSSSSSSSSVSSSSSYCQDRSQPYDEKMDVKIGVDQDEFDAQLVYLTENLRKNVHRLAYSLDASIQKMLQVQYV